MPNSSVNKYFDNNPFLLNYPGIVLVKDHNRKVVFINDYALLIWNKKKEDFIGKRFEDVLYFYLQPNEPHYESKLLEKNQKISFIQSILHKGKNGYWRFQKYSTIVKNKKFIIIIGDEDEEIKKKNETLNRSELYLRTIVDYSESIMIVVDRNCRVKNFLGSERIVNNPTIEFKTLIKEIIDRHASLEIKKNIHKVINNGKRYIEYKNVVCENHEFTFKDIYYPIEGINSSIEEIGILREDVSSNIEIQEAYSSIVNNTIIGLMIIKDNKIVFSNKNILEKTGYDEDSYSKFSIDDLIERVVPKNNKKELIKIYSKFKNSEIDSFNLQFPIKDKKRKTIWFEVYCNAIVYKGGRALQAAVIDITAKIDAEKNLKRNTHILNSTYEQVIYLDNLHKIKMVNRQTCLEFKKNHDYFYNMSVVDLLSPDLNREIIQNALVNCTKNGKFWRGERWIIYPDEGRFMEISMFPYFENQDELAKGVVVVLRDISEMINNELKMNDIAENERRKIAMELHDGLTHELLGVSINANILYKALLKQKIEDYSKAKKIEEGINSAIATARKLSKGLSPIKEENINLMMLVNELAEIVESRYDVKCLIEIDENIEINDERKLENIYYILDEAITNSIKHAGSKEVNVNIKKEGLFVQFEVNDKGRGFDIQKRAFGLGLTHMKRRARNISGTIDIRSAINKGTTVILKIKDNNPLQ